MGIQKYGQSWSAWVYMWEHSGGAEKCGAEESVVRLVKEIPRNQNFQAYFDKWFSCATKI